MFRGVNLLTLDAKGRLVIPSRYREPLNALCAGQLVITIDIDERCLLVYPLVEWEAVERKLDGLPSLDPRVRRVQRLLIGHATDCAMDGQGRVLIPPPLRQYARLDKQVVLIGQAKKFELWDEPLWNEQREVWLAEQGKAQTELPPELKHLVL